MIDWSTSLKNDPHPCPHHIKVLIEQYADAVEGVCDAMAQQFPDDREIEYRSNERYKRRTALRDAIAELVK